MDSVIAIIIILLIIAAAALYIFREKKKGKKCIGCPYADSCNSNKKCK